MQLFLLVVSATFLAQTWAQDCTKCSRTDVNTNTANSKDPLSHNPTVTFSQNTQGCSTMTVTCTPLTDNLQSLITFQNGLGGPAPGNPSTATLTCGNDGKWAFSAEKETTAITAVYCFG